MTSKASASSLATRMLWRLACTRTAIRYREKCATKDSQEIPVATNALMQIKEAGWSVGFGSPTRPHSPTKWQRRTGTALCTWWQPLTTKPMGTNCENICACHQLRVLRSWLVDSVASTDDQTQKLRGPSVGSVVGYVDQSGESRGAHVPAPRHGKHPRSIRWNSETSALKQDGGQANLPN